MVKVAEEKNTKPAYADLDHIVTNIYSICKAQQELLQEHVNRSKDSYPDFLL